MDLAGVIVNGTSGARDMCSTLVLLIYLTEHSEHSARQLGEHKK
jgi:hypothetical protein